MFTIVCPQSAATTKHEKSDLELYIRQFFGVYFSSSHLYISSKLSVFAGTESLERKKAPAPSLPDF